MVNAQQGCIYLTKIQYKKTVILYILLQFEMFIPIYSCTGKAGFSTAISPVFSVTWSFRNHFNMLIWC